MRTDGGFSQGKISISADGDSQNIPEEWHSLPTSKVFQSPLALFCGISSLSIAVKWSDLVRIWLDELRYNQITSKFAFVVFVAVHSLFKRLEIHNYTVFPFALLHLSLNRTNSNVLASLLCGY